MSVAIHTLLRRVREIQEDNVNEVLSLARKSKSPDVKNFAYSVIADEILIQELARALTRVANRLDDLSYEYSLAAGGLGFTEVGIQELERALLKLEELYIRHREIQRYLREIQGQVESAGLKDVLEALQKVVERLTATYNEFVGSVRKKVSERT